MATAAMALETLRAVPIGTDGVYPYRDVFTATQPA